MRIHHVALAVEDLERSRAFYVGVLGMTEVRAQPHSIWVDAGGALLMLERVRAGSVAHGALNALAFAIDPTEREAWRARVNVESETDFTLYFRDPDGHRIAVSSYPSK